MSIKETYTATELAKILKISRQTLWERARDENWTCIQRPKRNGGNAYYVTTLPEDIKTAIARHEADKAPKKILDGAVIPDWSHRIGLARYQVVAAWRSFCGQSKAKKMQATEAFLWTYNSGQLVKDAFAVVGQIGKSTLYNWDYELRENGDDYYSICDHRGKWNQGGPKGLGQLTPEAERLFLSIWLTPKPEVFESKFKKYDWLYTSCMEGYEPDAIEISFMKEYEASREYQEVTKPRYDQMRKYLGPLPQFGGRDAD